MDRYPCESCPLKHQTVYVALEDGAVLDGDDMTYRRGELAVIVPGRPFEVLAFLMMAPNRFVSANHLSATIIGPAAAPANVRIHIRRIRELIEPDPQHPRFVMTGRPRGHPPGYAYVTDPVLRELLAA